MKLRGGGGTGGGGGFLVLRCPGNTIFGVLEALKFKIFRSSAPAPLGGGVGWGGGGGGFTAHPPPPKPPWCKLPRFARS